MSKARPRAGWRAWTHDEDNLVRSLVAEGLTREQAVRRFKDAPSPFDDRNFRAIYMRSKKLGLRFADLRPRPWHFAGYVGWTEPRVALAQRWWRAGWSAAKIAKQLGHGISKNAVVGKLDRLHCLKPRQEVIRKPKPRPRPAKPRLPGKYTPQPMGNRTWFSAPRAPVPLSTPATDVARVSHDDLEAKHCRWIVGNAADAIAAHAPLYCGAPHLPFLPYCHEHAARAYRLIPRVSHWAPPEAERRTSPRKPTQ